MLAGVTITPQLILPVGEWWVGWFLPM